MRFFSERRLIFISAPGEQPQPMSVPEAEKGLTDECRRLEEFCNRMLDMLGEVAQAFFSQGFEQTGGDTVPRFRSAFGGVRDRVRTHQREIVHNLLTVEGLRDLLADVVGDIDSLNDLDFPGTFPQIPGGSDFPEVLPPDPGLPPESRPNPTPTPTPTPIPTPGTPEAEPVKPMLTVVSKPPHQAGEQIWVQMNPPNEALVVSFGGKRFVVDKGGEVDQAGIRIESPPGDIWIITPSIPGTIKLQTYSGSSEQTLTIEKPKKKLERFMPGHDAFVGMPIAFNAEPNEEPVVITVGGKTCTVDGAGKILKGDGTNVTVSRGHGKLLVTSKVAGNLELQFADGSGALTVDVKEAPEKASLTINDIAPFPSFDLVPVTIKPPKEPVVCTFTIGPKEFTFTINSDGSLTGDAGTDLVVIRANGTMTVTSKNGGILRMRPKNGKDPDDVAIIKFEEPEAPDAPTVSDLTVGTPAKIGFAESGTLKVTVEGKDYVITPGNPPVVDPDTDLPFSVAANDDRSIAFAPNTTKEYSFVAVRAGKNSPVVKKEAKEVVDSDAWLKKLNDTWQTAPTVGHPTEKGDIALKKSGDTVYALQSAKGIVLKLKAPDYNVDDGQRMDGKAWFNLLVPGWSEKITNESKWIPITELGLSLNAPHMQAVGTLNLPVTKFQFLKKGGKFYFRGYPKEDSVFEITDDDRTPLGGDEAAALLNLALQPKLSVPPMLALGKSVSVEINSGDPLTIECETGSPNPVGYRLTVPPVGDVTSEPPSAPAPFTIVRNKGIITLTPKLPGTFTFAVGSLRQTRSIAPLAEAAPERPVEKSVEVSPGPYQVGTEITATVKPDTAFFTVKMGAKSAVVTPSGDVTDESGIIELVERKNGVVKFKPKVAGSLDLFSDTNADKKETIVVAERLAGNPKLTALIQDTGYILERSAKNAVYIGGGSMRNGDEPIDTGVYARIMTESNSDLSAFFVVTIDDDGKLVSAGFVKPGNEIVPIGPVTEAVQPYLNKPLDAQELKKLTAAVVKNVNEKYATPQTKRLRDLTLTTSYIIDALRKNTVYIASASMAGLDKGVEQRIRFDANASDRFAYFSATIDDDGKLVSAGFVKPGNEIVPIGPVTEAVQPYLNKPLDAQELKKLTAAVVKNVNEKYSTAETKRLSTVITGTEYAQELQWPDTIAIGSHLMADDGTYVKTDIQASIVKQCEDAGWAKFHVVFDNDYKLVRAGFVKHNTNTIVRIDAVTKAVEPYLNKPLDAPALKKLTAAVIQKLNAEYR